MPDFPLIGDAPRETGRGASFSFVDFAGRTRSTRIELPAAADDAEVDALRTAIGNASNAAVVEQRVEAFERVSNIADADVITYDEGYPSVGDVAVFVFTNAIGDTQVLEIPAPDLPLFNVADYETINPDNALSAAIITAATAALNAGGSTYAFARGFYSKRKTKRVAVRTKPGTIGEPGVGDLPPA